jgi:hypothetical protein
MFRYCAHSRHIVYFQVKVINLVTCVCLHSVRIAPYLFTFSAHSRHIWLHSCKRSLTWSCDFFYILRDWSARLCDYNVALSDWSRAWSRDCDVIQILQSDWAAIPGPSLLSYVGRVLICALK